MTPERFREIIAKMTPPTWRKAELGIVTSGDGPQLYRQTLNSDDADVILALANHADALVELWCLASQTLDYLPDLRPTAYGNALQKALAKLEAIG